MNAPVATNRWNLALATKNTNSGPSSVASLNSGCGWALSIIRPSNYGAAILRDGACRLLWDEDITYGFYLNPSSAHVTRVSKDGGYSIPAIACAKSFAVNGARSS